MALIHGTLLASAKRYETPCNIAALAANYVPSWAKTLLEPAVGYGVLVEAALRGHSSIRSVTTVDIDLAVRHYVIHILSRRNLEDVEFIAADFLEWGHKARVNNLSTYDVIIMNPPFAAKRSAWRTVQTDSGTGCVPVEEAFLILAMQLLSFKGRLIAILPEGLICAERAQRLREALLNFGAIKCVHEFEPKDFPALKTRTFLLVVERDNKYHKYVYLKSKHGTLKLLRGSLNESKRLDYSYYVSCQSNNNERCVELPRLYSELGDVATVIRGSGNSKRDRMGSFLHTTDFREFKWLMKEAAIRHDTSSNHLAKQGDFLLSRVGRNCHLKSGIWRFSSAVECSDCLYIIRVKERNLLQQMILALRIALGYSEFAKRMLRGTGASYITKNELYSLPCPIKSKDVEYYAPEYARHAKRGDVLACLDIETTLAASLGLKGKRYSDGC